MGMLCQCVALPLRSTGNMDGDLVTQPGPVLEPSQPARDTGRLRDKLTESLDVTESLVSLSEGAARLS